MDDGGDSDRTFSAGPSSDSDEKEVHTRWPMVAEEELLDRARAGEEAAFTDLVRLYEQRMRAYARAMVRHDQDAEDLTQEALLRVYRALPLFQRQASFSTWIFRILNHLCLDHLRQRKRRPVAGELTREIEDGYSLSAHHPGPEDIHMQSELHAYLREALSRLPVEQRVVLVLHDVCAFKYREIGVITKCSVGTVKSRLFTARAKLRQIIDLPEQAGGDN
jgi:RNA polymerase sigma-70 factor (ECF subfamily)